MGIGVCVDVLSYLILFVRLLILRSKRVFDEIGIFLSTKRTPVPLGKRVVRRIQRRKSWPQNASTIWCAGVIIWMCARSFTAASDGRRPVTTIFAFYYWVACWQPFLLAIPGNIYGQFITRNYHYYFITLGLWRCLYETRTRRITCARV